MKESLPLPELPGYVSLKQAAKIIGLSVSRVYQYVEEERLPAVRAGRNIMLLREAVEQFTPDVAGRKRKSPPPWRHLKVGGPLLATLITVPVREGRSKQLEQRLRVFEQEERHGLAGTVARYIVKQRANPLIVNIFLVWKSSELPDEGERAAGLEALRADLSDVLDWSKASALDGEVLLHT